MNQIETLQYTIETIKNLKEKMKNADAIEKKNLKLEIIKAKQKMLVFEKRIVMAEKRKIDLKNKKLASAAARKCRSHGLICIALGVLYQQHKIDEFEKICFEGNSAVEEFAHLNFGYTKGETK